MGLLCLYKWHLQMEDAAFAQFAFDPDLAAMSLCHGFDDGESQPCAAFGKRLAVGAAIELFEQARQVGGGNANAAILHTKDQAGIVCTKLHCHFAFVWS